MDAKALQQTLQTGEDVLLIDVREEDEFAAGEKIPGSKNIPMGEVFVQEGQGQLPKDKKIITICRKGGRCEIVAKELRQKGYQIEHLEGGVEAWKEAKGE